MPLPSPSGNDRDAWMRRCMSSDAMKKEFPRNDQRKAVCLQKWKSYVKQRAKEDLDGDGADY